MYTVHLVVKNSIATNQEKTAIDMIQF